MSAPSLGGNAREIPTGRLAGFEDVDPPALTLPARPGRGPTSRDEGHPEAPGSGASEPRSDQSETRADPPADVAKRPHTGALTASNVHIPLAVLDDVKKTQAERNMASGDVIIVAIEATYERLKVLLRPRATAGGNLFGARVSRPARTPLTEPVTPLTYRLTSEEYEVLDRLVDELGATSRSHLVRVALNTYYGRDSV